MAVKNFITLYGTRYDIADGVNLSSSVETTSTAAYKHDKGSVFLYNGELYGATANIAVGGTITPDTNCERVYIGDDLDAVKNDIIMVQDTQPDSDANRIWLPETVGDGVEVPTMDEFNDLKSARYYINAKEYGAKGDGVTDDSVALQAALDYGAEHGYSVYIPAGVYLVNSTLNNKGVEIFGASRAISAEASCTTIKANATIGSMMTFTTPQNERYQNKIVRNITFNGNSKANICLDISNTVYLFFVYCMGGLYYGARANDCYNGIFKSCIFNHNGKYGLGIMKRNNNLTVLNCIINDNGTGTSDANLLIDNDSYNTTNNNANIKIIGCEIDESTGYNVSINGADVITFDGCYFEKSGVSAMQLRGVNAYAVNIIGCYFLDLDFTLSFSGLFIGNTFRLINEQTGTAKATQASGGDLLKGGNYYDSGYTTT